MFTRLAILAASLAAGCTPAPALKAEPPRTDLAAACGERDGWSDPAPAAHVWGNVWDVGTCGITVLLVKGDAGHVLIDGATDEAVPAVLANIRAAGADPRDVRWILMSHEHNDHVGGVAGLAAATGAKVAAGQIATAALERGQVGPDDPQATIHTAFPRARIDRVLADGETLTLGKLALTMHLSGVHAPGSANWTFTAQDADGQTQPVAYLDSMTTVAADDYRFTDHPVREAQVRAGFDRSADLPCGILLTPHPGASDMFERLAGRMPLVDGGACKRYVEDARLAFAARLAKERGR
jgi:metallo-beta-lactamase class B